MDTTSRLTTIIEILSQLVAFETLSRQSNRALTDWVRRYAAGMDVAIQSVPSDDNERENLLLRIGPDAPAGIVLSGHTDVVPVEGQTWESDPFTLTRRNGRLYGRGTCDMKGFLAVCLANVPDMLAAKLSKPIYLALSYDEEVGCLGAPDLAQAIARTAAPVDAVIVGEPSRMNVIEQHKGAMAGRVQFHGIDAHSSLPQLGVSATRAAIDFAARLIYLEETLRDRNTGVTDAFDPSYTTFNIGTIEGRAANNIIPAYCDLRWSARLMPGDDAPAIIGALRAEADSIQEQMRAQNPDCSVTFEITGNVPATQQEPNGVAAALCRQLSGTNHSEVASFATEGGIFQGAGFSTAICGPGSIEQAHKPNEFIEIEQLSLCDRFIQRLIARQCA